MVGRRCLGNTWPAINSELASRSILVQDPVGFVALFSEPIEAFHVMLCFPRYHHHALYFIIHHERKRSSKQGLKNDIVRNAFVLA